MIIIIWDHHNSIPINGFIGMQVSLLRTASNLITVTQVCQQTDMVAQNNTYSTHNEYTNMICLFGHVL